MESTTREIKTKLVGTTKRNDLDNDIQEILEHLSEQDHSDLDLEFVREPDNKYDENAIKVLCNGDHIGYLKKQLAEEIAGYMDYDHRVIGIVLEITGGGDKTYGCNIKLALVTWDEYQEELYQSDLALEEARVRNRDAKDSLPHHADEREPTEWDKFVADAVKNRWLFLFFCALFVVISVVSFVGVSLWIGIMCTLVAILSGAVFFIGMINS